MENKLGRAEKRKESINLIYSPMAKDIAKVFFREYTYPQKVAREIYGKKSSTVEYFFTIWNNDKNKYFETKSLREVDKSSKNNLSYKSAQVHYLLNLKPYFLYLMDKGIILTEDQKTYLSDLFDPKLRKEIDYSKGALFEIIDQIIREDISHYFTRQFEELENINLEKEEKFPFYISLANKYFDEFTLELIREHIFLKLKHAKNRKNKNLKFYETLYWMFHADKGLRRVIIKFPGGFGRRKKQFYKIPKYS